MIKWKQAVYEICAKYGVDPTTVTGGKLDLLEKLVEAAAILSRSYGSLLAGYQALLKENAELKKQLAETAFPSLESTERHTGLHARVSAITQTNDVEQLTNKIRELTKELTKLRSLQFPNAWPGLMPTYDLEQPHAGSRPESDFNGVFKHREPAEETDKFNQQLMQDIVDGSLGENNHG